MTFEDPHKSGVERRKPYFEMARRGFNEVLVPSLENARLIEEAEREFLLGREQVSEYYGVHLRRLVDSAVLCGERIGTNSAAQFFRGDRHPMNWKHKEDYIPLEKFVKAIEDREAKAYHLTQSFVYVFQIPSPHSSKKIENNDATSSGTSPAIHPPPFLNSLIYLLPTTQYSLSLIP